MRLRTSPAGEHGAAHRRRRPTRRSLRTTRRRRRRPGGLRRSAEALLDEFASPHAVGPSAGCQSTLPARAVQRANVTTKDGKVLDIKRKLDTKHRNPPDEYRPFAVAYFDCPTTDGIDPWFPNAWTLEDITIVRSRDNPTTIISAFPSLQNTNLVNVKILLDQQRTQQQERERWQQRLQQQWLHSDDGQRFLQQRHQQQHEALQAMLLTHFPALQQAWTGDAETSPSHDAPTQGDLTVSPSSLPDSASELGAAFELPPDAQTQPPTASATTPTAGQKRKFSPIPPASGRGPQPGHPPTTRVAGTSTAILGDSPDTNLEPSVPRIQGHTKRIRSERVEGDQAGRDAQRRS
jgi:hypothetical protein